jgi:hypothetical protein
MAKKTGHGIQFKIDHNNNSTFDTVAQVMSITPGGINVEEVNATTLDSALVSFIPASINEYPPITLSLAYDPNSSTHANLRAVAEARTEFAAQIVFSVYSPSKTLQFGSGFLTAFTPGEVTSTGLMTCTVTYRPTAVPSFT